MLTARHFQVGSLVGRFEDVDEGVRECWIASQLEPEWELPLVEIGIIYINAGRHEEAKSHLVDVETQSADPSWHLLFNLGEARRRCGDNLGALTAFEKAIELNPQHPLLVDRAGHCAFLTGDSVKGLRYAKKAKLLGSLETFSDWERGAYRKNPKTYA